MTAANPSATGDVRRTADGVDLVLTRTYAAPVADVWASVTEPDRTARWFGPWRGEAGPGRTVQVQMTFEGSPPDGPWTDVLIDACEPPHHLAVTTNDEAGTWHLELHLSESGGVTTLTLVDHRPSVETVGDHGPGWEWYLDSLTASRDDTKRPVWDDYYPVLKEPYEELGRRVA